ncbi:MAG: Zn-ribbon domain-containing OB-fold protein [Halieaceae bacterium]|nr:Zn-ribbon domain-containing OB-fold protein [Halieaceae bacterium]
MPDISDRNPDRPDPIMTTDGAVFWKGAEQHKLVVQKCGDCGAFRHPPRAMCPHCHSLDVVEHELSGTGSVISWVQPVHPPAIGFTEPPIVAVVELEHGIRLVSNVEGAEASDMRFGMAVKAAYAKTAGGKTVPIFVPDEGDD